MPNNSIKGASRNLRELSVATEVGYKITVVSADIDIIDGEYKYIYSGVRHLTYDIPKLNRIGMIISDNKSLIRKLRKIDKDVISCHNITALFIGWMSTWFISKKRKPKLIYDSHEFEIGRSGDRSRAEKWFITHLERFLIKRCAFSIMVNNSIADEVQRIHKLKQRPIVVRSTPNLWNIDETIIKQKRHELLSVLGVSDDTFTIMYHGGIMNNRGIESVIELVSMNPNIVGIILGNGDAKYMESLKSLTVQKGVSDRILFHPAVSIDELWKYVGAADAGMVILRNVCTNHYYSLPNKFFENIQSLTPIIGSDFPEIRRIVNEYGIGLLCDPSDLIAMNDCVEKMRTDGVFYESCKLGLVKAKEDLCWENEKKVLIEVYGNLIKEINE